jgi:hypothetical protein
MKTRTDLLNHLAENYQLKRYLEIGVQNPDQNFNKINCDYKVSVDPEPNAHASFCMTSDEFFYSFITRGEMYKDKIWEKNKFDLIFIDGLHTAEQVQKDFENALRVLSPEGFIVLHDLLPETYERTLVPRPTKTGSWNGSCWKFGCKLGLIEDFVTVNIDNGCGVWRNGGGYYVPSPKEWSWNEFEAHKRDILNVIEWEHFIKLYDGRMENSQRV